VKPFIQTESIYIYVYIYILTACDLATSVVESVKAHKTQRCSSYHTAVLANSSNDVKFARERDTTCTQFNQALVQKCQQIDRYHYDISLILSWYIDTSWYHNILWSWFCIDICEVSCLQHLQLCSSA
jgi:hypothetical protein